MRKLRPSVVRRRGAKYGNTDYFTNIFTVSVPLAVVNVAK